MRLLSALLLSLVPACAAAQPDMARLGLIEGWRDGATHMAGLAIDLDPGWKTYWRAPGEAGIPPHFDWSGSRNLVSVRVHWPAPEVFDQGGATSIGYAFGTVLPLEMTPRDPYAPIHVNLSAGIGVCQDICIPIEARLSAELPASRARPDARIAAALGAVPATARSDVRCEIAAIEDGVRLTAHIQTPPRPGREHAAIELPGAAVWVSTPRAVRHGGTLTATADLVPPRGTALSLDRSALRFTVLSDAGAVEMTGCR